MSIYSVESYSRLMRTALDQGYTFVGFEDASFSPVPRLHLRHDVDFSLSMAVELAQLNHSIGVRGTFFLMLRSEAYNLLSASGREAAKSIHDVGQWLGLHVPVPRSVRYDRSDLVPYVERELSLCRSEIPMMGPVFSWHNPTQALLDSALDIEFSGSVSAYSRRLFRDTGYISDSNLRHSVVSIDAQLRTGEDRLQLLLHPCIWIGGGQNMFPILGRTWRYIIREREEAFLANDVYRGHLPLGLPDEILDTFELRLTALYRGEVGEL